LDLSLSGELVYLLMEAFYYLEKPETGFLIDFLSRSHYSSFLLGVALPSEMALKTPKKLID
jgi:hypothetical protein